MILGDKIVAGDVDGTSMADFVSLQGLSAFLSLTSDAIAGYGPDGHIVIANDPLSELTGLAPRQLIGMDVRSLLLLADGALAPEGEWPFPLDGSPVLLRCRRPSEGSFVSVAVRALPLGAQGNFVVALREATARDEEELAAEPIGLAGDENAERDADAIDARPLSDSEAIQDALASPDFTQRELWQFLGSSTNELSQVLFEPVVEELRSCVDADSAALFIEDAGIYHLKASAGSLGGRLMPLVLEHIDFNLVEGSAKHLMRLQVPEPERAGNAKSGLVTVGNLDTDETIELMAKEVPPLAMQYVLPLRFGTEAKAIVVVGWLEGHAMAEAEERVLYLLARHLGAEASNAFGTLRTQAADRVEQVMRQIRRNLEEAPDLEGYDYDAIFELIAKAVHGVLIPCEVDEAGALAYRAADGRQRRTRADLDALMGDATGHVRVVSASTSRPFRAWLESEGLEPKGALIDIDDLGGERRTLMILRSWDVGPLESFDVTFLRRCLLDVCTQVRERRELAEANYISQSLQRGMGSRIQTIPGIRAHGIYNSATANASVGGDFYDVLSLPGHKVGIVLGDVAGKGVMAASVASAVRTALAAYAWEGLGPSYMVRLLNDFFMGFTSLETFASIFAGVLDMGSGMLTYCSAGHPPALLLRPSDGYLSFLESNSGVVGAFREMVFSESRVELQPGDEILLYSDGVTEARDPKGRFFEEAGLRDAVVELLHVDVGELPSRILERLFEFTGNNMRDDCALLAVEFLGNDGS